MQGALRNLGGWIVKILAGRQVAKEWSKGEEKERLEIFAHPGTKGGGLNLPLAFNGVCKLYLDGEEGKGRKEF